MQLENILGSKTKIKVLRKLAMQPHWQFSVTELAKDLKLDKALISRAVSDLEKMNVIKTLKKGPVKLININEANEFVKSIMSIFTEPIAAVDRTCKDFIRRLNPNDKEIESILLYGSTVKGTFTPASDIDIMIIVKKHVAELKEHLDKISHEFSKKDIIIFHDIITEAELQKLLKQRQPTIIDIAKNHKVIWGKEVL